MEIRSTSAVDTARIAPLGSDPRAHLAPLSQLLWGDGEVRQLPPLADLISAAIALATGQRRKCLLRLPGDPAELALVRDGDAVRVSGYETGPAPDVWVLDRVVALRDLLHACSAAAEAHAATLTMPTESEIVRRLAERALATQIAEGCERPRALRRRGGCIDDPGDAVPLAFGFDARIVPCPIASEGPSARADVHALLYEGRLWAWARGRRIELAQGPIVLVAQRMVAAVRALIDAADADRSAHVRLRSGSFHVGVRHSSEGIVALTLGADPDSAVTLPALGLADAALPILRLGSDLVRALVSVDRSQARNLRVRAFREDVRALRRRVRARERSDGFVNRDPDRLRAAVSPERSDTCRPIAPRPAGRLRFVERWSTSVEELDASSTFACGDRLIVATPRRMIALSRDEGRVLWVREGNGGSTAMAGRTLVRLDPDGTVELCDVRDGEAYATTRITPRVGPPIVLAAGAPGAPLAVVAEGESRLSAIDLRNGDPLWRYHGRGSAPLRVTRVARLIIVASAEGTLDAIDVTSGEIVWRLAERTRFCFAPVITRDVVVAPGGEPGSRSGALFGVDLFSGELLWRRRLPAAPSAGPVAASTSVALALGGPRQGSLACFRPSTGELRWMVPDPGVGAGGACLAVDRALVVNAPAGRLTALDLDNGETRWTKRLADPVADDVPRRLEPVLRGGALFVPAASVHIVRPADGSELGAALPCDLVPDLVRVDERGWVYVAEESGHLAAYAPAPQLTLVPSADV